MHIFIKQPKWLNSIKAIFYFSQIIVKNKIWLF
jgi:hypothetical protein